VGWGENDRGVSFTFGEDVVAQFLRRHDLDLICRAHQVRVATLLCAASHCLRTLLENSDAHPASVCCTSAAIMLFQFVVLFDLLYLVSLRCRWWRTGTSSSPSASW
jgi:hypothetical protein